MPNLLKNVQSSCQEAFKDKIAVAFMALVLVVAVNHIVFSYLLFEREQAEAFTASALSESLFFNFNDHEIQAGTNDVLLAEFDMPDAMLNTNLACGFILDIPNETGAVYDNACFTMLDADGFQSLDAGVNDDNTMTLYDLAYKIGDFGNVEFDSSDCIFTDNYNYPTEIYYDLNCNGIPGDVIGEIDPIILDLDGSGVMDAIPALPYLNVASSNGMLWAHSERVANNDIYDFDTGTTDNIYTEDSGVCGTQVDVLTYGLDITMWQDVLDDGVFDPSVDTIIWDPNNCLSTPGPCANGGCTSSTKLSLGASFRYSFIWNGDGSKSVPPNTACAGITDGVWQTNEPIWLEDLTDVNNTLGVYDFGIDWPIYDPAGCLAGGEIGIKPLDQTKVTEAIWLVNPWIQFDDQIIHEGSWWDSEDEALISKNQFQNDQAGILTKGCGVGILNGECTYDDFSGTNLYNGYGVIIDVDGSGTFNSGDIDVYGIAGAPLGDPLVPIKDMYSNDPKFLGADCNGSFGYDVGGCATLDAGDPLIPLAEHFSHTPNGSTTDNWSICTDSLTFPTVVFADEDGQCDGGTGEMLFYWGDWDPNYAYEDADHAATFANFNAAGVWSFYDNNSSSTYNIGEDIYFNPAYDPILGNVVGTEMQYFNLIFSDINGDGLLDPDGKETLLRDTGAMSTGPGGNNGVIDCSGLASKKFANFLPFNDLVYGADFRNFGSALAGVDFTNVRLFVDLGGGDGRCTGPGGDDIDLGEHSFSGNRWALNFGDLLGPLIGPGFEESGFPLFSWRACVVANIPADARTGATIKFGLSKFEDNGTIGQFDSGLDEGFLVASENSGPTDGPLVMPYTIKIVGGTRALPTGTSGKSIPKASGEPTAPAPEPGIEQILPPQLPSGVENGEVVKGASSNTVYAIVNGKRRPIPDTATYLSWFDDSSFSLVKQLSDSQISDIVLDDKNLTVRAGTWLIKNASSPNVYAVEPNGVRRLIETETIAMDLYGSGWKSKIIDVADAFWGDYTEGKPISRAVYATGSLIQYAGTAEVYYIEEAVKRPMDPPTYVANHFQDKFIIRDVDAGMFDYPIGPALAEFSNLFMSMENGLFRTFSASIFRR